MRMKTSLFKRSLAALLSFVMVLGMVPAMNLVPEAEAAEVPAVSEDHITMPITIRDFAADGMLFEYNETSDSGVAYKNGTTGTIAVYLNKTYYNNGNKYDYPYIWEYSSFTTMSTEFNEYWYVVFINSDGTVNRVCTGDQVSANTAIPENGKVIFAHNSAANGAYLGNIQESNKANYVFGTITTDSSVATGAYVSVTRYEAAYHQANTKGFGMLYTDETDINNNIYMWDTEGAIKESLVAWNDFSDAEEYGESVSGGTYDGFLKSQWPTTSYPEGYGPFYHYSPYQLFGLWDYEAGESGYANQMLYGGTIRTNLMKMELENGKPVYTPNAVTYIAEYMKLALSKPWQNADGSYNTSYVTGQKVAGNETLAERIRQEIASAPETDNDKLGYYTTSKAKFDAGGLRTYEDIETWFDAAYFIMHNTWRDSSKTDDGSDGYGMPVPEYHSLHLIAKTDDTTGKTTYVFNSMYTDAVYNPETGEIYNTQIENYEHAVNNNNNAAYADGNPQPVDRFDPLGKYGTGIHGTAQYLGYNATYGPSPDTYGDMIEPSDANWADYYDETNYHLSLEGHAQFVYHEAADQYFTFTGDDDVYLYINNIRVLDIGGGHSIAKVGIRLNDIAKNIGLVDGETYPFDFFYMERHGTAANFGIETNIQIADASMNTSKQGFQGGVNTGYGGPVNKDNHVGYTFELQNDGTAHIYNLTFNDPTIGVYVGYDKIQLNQAMSDLYTINDLYLIYWDADGTMHYNPPGTFTVETLKERLRLGLDPGARLGVYGFKYRIPTDAWKDSDGDEVLDFINTVYTTATNEQIIGNTTKTLQGVADWKVVQMQVPYLAFHVYDTVHKIASNDPKADTAWKSPSVTVPFSKLDDYLAAEIEKGKLTQDQIDDYGFVVLCTASGNEESNNQRKNITTNGRDITFTSETTGKDTVFFKFNFKDPDNPDKVLETVYDDLVFSYEVYTYGAADNIYVLDYGLPVELAGQNFGFQTNDLLVNNHNNNSMRITASVVEGSNSSNYGDFTFTSAVDTAGNTNIASLKYTPKKIINGTDSIEVHVRIVETNEDGTEKTLDKYTGVEMTQLITTAPASVVYYEENFANNVDGGITFVDGAFGNWAQYETMKPVYDEDGKLTGYEPIAGLEQSPDQDMNYGSNFTDDNGTPDDPSDDIIYAYDQDKEGVLVGKDAEGNYQVGTDEDNLSYTLEYANQDELTQATIDAINDYLAIRGGDSNGSVKELVINTTNQVEAMYFTFVGTGVEIIGRTTDDAFAVINVIVQRVNRDEEGNITGYTTSRMKPVITESIGGDQYQVPIISFTGLEKAEYRVSLKVAKSESTTVDRMLYIDGVRIYGPLGIEDALEYYNPEENKAEIFEVKQLIEDEFVVFCSATETDDLFQSVIGSTLVENNLDTSVLKSITSSVEYLDIGPNNELYLRGQSKPTVIAFFIRETANYVGPRTLEIGAHRKADSDTLSSTASVNLIYGSIDTDLTSAKAGSDNFYSVDTGTEMYYTIDIQQLDVYDLDDVEDECKGYIVMIGTNGASKLTAKDALALTNLKVAGYTITSVAEELVRLKEEQNKNQQKSMISMALINESVSVLKGWIAAAKEAPEEEKLPVNENLRIELVDFSENTVASGWYAMMTVKATSNADSIVIYDADGKAVELAACDVRTKGGAVYFDVAWLINGSRGEVQKYTIRVFDSEKLASVNTEAITVTIV